MSEWISSEDYPEKEGKERKTMYKCNECGAVFEDYERIPVVDDGIVCDSLCPNCGSGKIEEE